MKDSHNINGQLILLFSLLAIFVFVFYSSLCLTFQWGLPCLIDQNKLFKKQTRNTYISSFLEMRSRKIQEIEVHRLLQKSVNELKLVLSQLNNLNMKHEKYFETEGKLKVTLNNFVYLFKDLSLERNNKGKLYTEEVKTRIDETIQSNEDGFNEKYWKLKNLLFNKKDLLEERINYLTNYIKSINSRLDSSDLNMDSGSSGVKWPATKLYADIVKNDEIEIINLSKEVNLNTQGNSPASRINFLLNSLYTYSGESEKLLKSLSKGSITREKLKQLFKNGEKLENKGDYEKGLQIYRNILIFNLSPFDRDLILKKIERINRKIVIDTMIRKQNKYASGIKAVADQYKQSGDTDDAIKLYVRIIKEYPNSNYVDGAIDALLECRKSYNK